ncbi:MAG: diguanylate cyclase [Polaromonas sp.]|uniref:diguanylate cyclase n=1 Tax=Polaromonas sp. TaxID=1869339 RepID=UPI003267B78B
MQEPIRFILLYIVMPGWLAAGLADWACHRRSDIAHTSGTKESLLHLLMIGQVGVGVLAALFLRINSAVLLLLLVLLLGHALTSHWDLHYAARRRHVSAMEQSIHAYLEGFPLAAYALLMASHWSQFSAIFGADGTAPDWTWRLKEDPLPAYQTALLLLGSLCLGLAPFAEELYRSLRAAPKARVPLKPRL